MSDAADNARHAVDIGRRDIAEQKSRIERQCELIESLGGNQHAAEAQKALTELKQMNDRLSEMERELTVAERRLMDLTDPLDEAVLEKVMKECPL